MTMTSQARSFGKAAASEAAVDRTALYGARPYAHLRVEFERRLQALPQAGEIPDPKKPKSSGSRQRSPSSGTGWLSRNGQSTSSWTSAPRPWHHSPHNTKRSSGSATPSPGQAG